MRQKQFSVYFRGLSFRAQLVREGLTLAQAKRIAAERARSCMPGECAYVADTLGDPFDSIVVTYRVRLAK